MNFSEALERLKAGSKMARVGWNGPAQFVYCEAPCGPYVNPQFAIRTTVGQILPWFPTHGDLLAGDWEIET